MPNPNEILAGLTAIARDNTAWAVAWHIAAAAFLVAWIAGLRPSRRTLALALSLPLLSVGVMAWKYGNPFNGAVFPGAALALCALALKTPSGRATSGTPALRLAGGAMIGFGLFYPHFLPGGAAWAYLYAAPTGLIPCPTLSLTVGVALFCGGLGSRAWAATLAGLGLFYGLFGVLRLRVGLDIVLAAGAALLLVVALGTRPAAK